MFVFYSQIIIILLGPVSILASLPPVGPLLVFGYLLLFPLLMVPILALIVRRIHDQNRSALWLGVALIVPPIGLLVLLLLPSSQGRNKYGPDPRRPGRDPFYEEVFS